MERSESGERGAEKEEEKKVDPGAKGLHECGYGSGFETCTEGLGCESCDGGAMATDEVACLEMCAGSTPVEEWREEEEEGERLWREEQRAFPPPLRCRRGWMRAERRDGRLILTEVRIERPKVFHARRESGRLRLQLIEYEDADEAKVAAHEEKQERDGRWSGKGMWRCQEAAAAIGAATRSPSLLHHRRFMMAA